MSIPEDYWVVTVTTESVPPSPIHFTTAKAATGAFLYFIGKPSVTVVKLERVSTGADLAEHRNDIGWWRL